MDDKIKALQSLTFLYTAIMRADTVEFVHGEHVGYDTRTGLVSPCEAADMRHIGRSVRNDDGQVAYELRGQRVVNVLVGMHGDVACRCGAALFTGADTMPDMNVAPVLGVPGVIMLQGTCYRCGIELSCKPMHTPTVRWYNV